MSDQYDERAAMILLEFPDSYSPSNIYVQAAVAAALRDAAEHQAAEYRDLAQYANGDIVKLRAENERLTKWALEMDAENDRLRTSGTPGTVVVDAQLFDDLHKEIAQLRAELATLKAHQKEDDQDRDKVEAELESEITQLCAELVEKEAEYNLLVGAALADAAKRHAEILQRVANSSEPACDKNHGKYCDCVGDAVRIILADAEKKP